jgi:hypothetical protein
MGPRGPVGVINVVGLAIPELEDQATTLASLEGESVDERIQRRLVTLDADDARGMTLVP